MAMDRATAEISVVLGTYNGALHIEEQLRSVIEQSRPPAEIIVSDDRSTDRTVEIVESIAAGSAVPIHILRNETQLGFADNFLRATAASTGRFVAFSDQDDRWEPLKLERSAAALMEHDAVLCSHAVDLMDEHGRPLGRQAQTVPSTAVIEPRTADPWGVFYGFSVMIDRRLFEAVPAADRGPDTYGQRPRLSHDRWMYALAWGLGRSVRLPEPLAHYRQHSNQLYGGPSARTLRTRIAQKASEGPSRLDFLAGVASRRAGLMAEADWRSAEDAAAAAAAWSRLADLYTARARLYSTANGLARAWRLAQLVGDGGYRSIGGRGVGAKRAVEDFAFGLPGRAVRDRLTGLGAAGPS